MINNKQIENIKSKSLRDNVYVMFWPKYELDILNRELTPDQLSILKSESSNKEIRKKNKIELEKELADLVLKRVCLEAELNLIK